MVLTEGTLAAGQTITNVTLQTFNAPPIDFEDIPTFVCFCADTRVETPEGLRRIGELEVGDYVTIQSGEHRPFRWIARREITRRDFHRRPALRPVRICQGSLGDDLPTTDLVLSRQHRVLVSSKIVERVIGHPEALISANKLTTLPGVYVDQKIDAITYVHLMLDDHEILTTAGVGAESLYLGPEARASLTPDAIAEIELIFPELRREDGPPSTKHQIPCGRQQKAIVRRHLKNDKPLCANPPATSVWHQTNPGHRTAALAVEQASLIGRKHPTRTVNGF